MKNLQQNQENHVSMLPSAATEFIPAEVIVAIAAAVAAVTGGLGTITGIREQGTATRIGRPVWSMAGLLENTRPF